MVDGVVDGPELENTWKALGQAEQGGVGALGCGRVVQDDPRLASAPAHRERAQRLQHRLGIQQARVQLAAVDPHPAAGAGDDRRGGGDRGVTGFDRAGPQQRETHRLVLDPGLLEPLAGWGEPAAGVEPDRRRLGVQLHLGQSAVAGMVEQGLQHGVANAAAAPLAQHRHPPDPPAGGNPPRADDLARSVAGNDVHAFTVSLVALQLGRHALLAYEDLLADLVKSGPGGLERSEFHRERRAGRVHCGSGSVPVFNKSSSTSCSR